MAGKRYSLCSSDAVMDLSLEQLPLCSEPQLLLASFLELKECTPDSDFRTY